MIEDWQNAGWPVVRVRDIGRLHGGGTPSRKRPEFFQGDIPWITGQDIPDNYVATIEKSRDYVTEEAVAESATRVIPAGAVLITTRVSVGKTAVAGRPICFSQDITALLIHSEAIALPAYVAHYLRSRQPVLLQKNQGSTIAGITRDSLALERIPLPPLSEQQRIVDTLQEAEEIRRLRAQAEAKTAELIPALFRHFFGDITSNPRKWPVAPVSHFVKAFEGGKSLTGIDTGVDDNQPRVLKISAVTSGFLLPSESKPLPAGYDPPATHRVRVGDLLITRANTEELVGATALVGKDCPSNLLLPDKIWRFVWKEDFEGTPEFVWALFQQNAMRKALGNIATGTGGSMKNISMAKLMQMRVIWPPKSDQERFSVALRELVVLINDQSGNRLITSLTAILSANAFTGQLTEEWREKHQKKLTAETRDRDAALQHAGIRDSQSRRATIQEIETIFEMPTDGIYSELNREQRDLLGQVRRMVGGVDYGRYFTAEQLAADLKGSLHRNPQAIESHLSVFAVRGLVIPVSRPRNDNTGSRFAACYRLPLKEDDVRSERLEHQRKLAVGDI